MISWGVLVLLVLFIFSKFILNKSSKIDKGTKPLSELPASEFAKYAIGFFWEKIEKQPKNGFDTIWSSLALASATSFLDSLFFSETKIEGHDDPFFKNRQKLDNDNFVKLCKILIGHYLYVFLSSPNNVNLIRVIYQDTENLVKSFFEQNIFMNFDFAEKDISLYRSWGESFTIKLYSELMVSIDANNYKNPHAGLAFEEMSLKSYESFVHIFEEKMKSQLPRQRKFYE